MLVFTCIYSGLIRRALTLPFSRLHLAFCTTPLRVRTNRGMPIKAPDNVN